MQTLDHDEVTLSINASPDVVYALVSDVTRTPEFSPEIIDCRWLDGATGPAVGARFQAQNRTSPSRPSWSNTPVVTVADPGREFAFSRTEKFAGTIVWRYLLEPEGNRTRVTESYTVVKPVRRVGWFIIEKVFGNLDRRSDLRSGMQETLRRLSAAAENDHPAASSQPGSHNAVT
ncbi:MAG: SRPBCC family protein [Actinomycetota bacterium]|nr:SRPBCC family protein [Actinomycetota bacterium]